MLLYYLKFRKRKTERKSPRIIKTNKERVTILSKYAVCDREKSKLIKEKEARGLSK